MAEENKAEQKTPAGGDARDRLESSKQHARKAAEDLKSAAGSIAEEYRGKAEQKWGEARGKAEQAWGDARRSRPHISGRRGAICARKSNEGDFYRARNRVCSGVDLPALTPKAFGDDQRELSVPQSCGACRLAPESVRARERTCGVL